MDLVDPDLCIDFRSFVFLRDCQAGVVKLVDAADSKSAGLLSPCRFDSGPRHIYAPFGAFVIEV